MESYKLKIVLILAFGFSLASIFGYISQRLKLSPLLGYLIAGYLIGPYSPGFVADVALTEELAEVGVILMMFGVGLHLKWQDLFDVKYIAIPGAICQTLVSVIVGTLLVVSLGWPISSGIIIGMAIGVASTVVLIRILTDKNLIHTLEGHISVGWLIVEDILTVVALLMLPLIANLHSENILKALSFSFIKVIVKFGLLVSFMIFLGRPIVAFILHKIADLKSNELFTLTIFGLIFITAVASAFVFGTSLALGAFISGMVIGQTQVRHQALANALPLKDTFMVIFFLTVGMLFNPVAILENVPLFLGILGIILLLKPLVAFLLVLLMKYPIKTALTIAVALAQIGEFSFILSEEAMKLDLLPNVGYDVIVASALISIAINPIYFSMIDVLKKLHERYLFKTTSLVHEKHQQSSRRAIIVGYGPVGQQVAKYLHSFEYNPFIIESNLNTIESLDKKQQALYGDATLPEILNTAKIETAQLLVITTPDINTTLSIIHSARNINKNIQIFARTRYLSDIKSLEDLGIKYVCCEQETIKGFKRIITSEE